jgi:copper chaperone CopZ
MHTTTVVVEGMTCHNCAALVTHQVESLPGVSGVGVDLPAGTVTVTSTKPLALSDIHRAIDEAGYLSR